VSQWSRFRVVAWLALVCFGAGCSEQTVTVELRSLQASGDVSYVCRTTDGEGVPQAECSPGSLFTGERDLFALVTQTSTGEIAVVNVPYDVDNKEDDEGVVDVDPSAPGYGFLRIGARPGDIVSTPGGRASFVGVAEPGRFGIYGLPTSCVGAPRAGETVRDLTTWPACSLPAAPAGLAIAFDSATRCDGSAEPSPAEDRECPVDLAGEIGARGRHKLIVSMPDRGSLAVIDAQELLNRASGSFALCDFVEVPLSVELPASPSAPDLPADLVGCPPAPSPLPAGGPVSIARPTRIEAADGTLYVADEGAPVVHVVDASSACTPRELPPLLPSSYWAPQRSVTVSRLSVSPITPRGKRYLYAIDELDWPLSSVMAFDVSPGSSKRSPVLRPGSTLTPNEPPDRITFGAAVRDITFVLRDRPEFGTDTSVPLGESCEPDPNLSDSPGARYRPDIDRSTGARPLKLRGLFGMAMLTTGEVAVIDVEDFDAPCRRPRVLNPSATEDFSGCAGDPPLASGGDYSLSTGVATVTDEVSCRAVEPHRRRAQRLSITRNDIGIQAPSLRSLPILSVPSESQILELNQRPKLLAVEDLARVFVGTTEYRLGGNPALEIDPSLAEEHSLGLPFNQPRAYPADDDRLLEFEGAVSEEYRSGFVRRNDAGELVLRDSSALFCNSGVSDPELTAELGARRFGLVPEAERAPGDPRPSLESFQLGHSDHVLITAGFPDEDDAYWPGQVLRDDGTDLQCSLDQCEQYFGEIPERLVFSELPEARQFSIVDAEQQRLVLEPRYHAERLRDISAIDCTLPTAPANCESNRAAAQEQLMESRAERRAMVECCFPEATSYQVRASGHWTLNSSRQGFRHDVVAVAESDGVGGTVVECRRDCDPRKRDMQARIFEIARDHCTPREGLPCQVSACVTGPRDGEQAWRAVHADEAAWACVQRTTTSHFALYQGQSPSVRGMSFGWQVVGGFTPLTIDLGLISSFVSPQAIVPLPELDRLSVVDASSLGLALIGLDGMRALLPTLN
jgi:hypothetical protein